MSTKRCPTAKQLDLLRSIADGNVISDIGDERVWEVGYVVTRRVRALESAGWCTTVERGEFLDWTLTDAGRAQLDAAQVQP